MISITGCFGNEVMHESSDIQGHIRVFSGEVPRFDLEMALAATHVLFHYEFKLELARCKTRGVS